MSFTSRITFLYLILTVLTISSALSQSGSVRGTVYGSNGQSKISNVLLIIRLDSVMVDSIVTGSLGEYYFTNLEPNVFTISASKNGFFDKHFTNIAIQSKQVGYFNLIMSNDSANSKSNIYYQNGLISDAGIGKNENLAIMYPLMGNTLNLSCVVVKGYSVPLISSDRRASTVTREQINKMPIRSATAIASTTTGVSSIDGEIGSIRGARPDANSYYIDGVQVKDPNSIPPGAIDNVTVIRSGIPASYGDVTGGIISITTKSYRHRRPVPQYKSYTSPVSTYVEPDITDNFNPNNTESYDIIYENEYQNPLKEPLSTFSIDVDKASYANIRRFINKGIIPPKGAIRVEEMINYFDYNYPNNTSVDKPIGLHTELAVCPWNQNNLLLKVGMKGWEIKKDSLPPSNLVFLIDVSGSMESNNKLPLLIKSLQLLTSQLRDQDKISIVVYAGSSGVVLEPTSGKFKNKILSALDRLNAGGSTNGSDGIQMAYQLAEKHFIKQGNNRVLLATDGDFNVGVSSNDQLIELIEAKRESGVYLTTLGFGMGNYKDDKLEILADKGNGNYFYIDSFEEAKKVLVKEIYGTLYAIAKDVKLQLEFNPSKVKGYRLIGYENRLLKNQDFRNDRVDAGELGAGHCVTALYEIVPGVANINTILIDSLRYQKSVPTEQSESKELLRLKCRYKLPESDISNLMVIDVSEKISEPSDDFKFAASVAAFGMNLRGSRFCNNIGLNKLRTWAKGAVGNDENGYRSQFLQLVESVSLIQQED